MPPIVVVAGVSGLGKTWMLNRAMEGVEGQVLSASTLIVNELNRSSHWKTVEQDQLRELDINANQRALSLGFERSIDPKASMIILDAHVVIDTIDGLTFISHEVFERIDPIQIIFVSGVTEEMSARRQTDGARRRLQRTPEELGQQQTVAHDWAKEIAHRLGTHIVKINADDIETLNNTLISL